ncbi:MAG: beta-N-acetylhexosaminidase [Proteobacteria bacterium]|nr:beta-N-acetylhexosaminidase [Pseudomonadota bacterium]
MRSELETLAGRVILAGFDGTALPDVLRRDIKVGAAGGLVLFRRNVESVAQVHELLCEARTTAPKGRAPITALDQEGGRVIRIREPLAVLPPMRQFGQRDCPRATEQAGTLVGKELRALGFTTNFAPVLDIDTHPASPVIGDRAFSGEVSGVITHGLAFARGLKMGGVHPVAKHFPGHGDAAVDSHVSLPVVAHDAHRLHNVELAPFAAWAQCNGGALMTAHVRYPALDAHHPATTSHAILTQLLRQQLGFSGTLFSDDLEMGAMASLGGAAQLAVRILEAGVDGLLICRDLALRERVIEQLARAAADDKRFLARLEEAAAHLAPMSIPPGEDVDFSFIGSDAHRHMKAALMGERDTGEG